MKRTISNRKHIKAYALLFSFFLLVPTLVRAMEHEEEQDKNSITKFLWENKDIISLVGCAVYGTYNFVKSIRLREVIFRKEKPAYIKSFFNSVLYNPFLLNNPVLEENLMHDALRCYKYSNDIMPVMQVLIDHGADPFKQDHAGNTIFHRAARDANMSSIYENLCSLTKQCSGKKITLIDLAHAKNILKIQNNKGELVEDILSENLYKTGITQTLKDSI